jgi:hypothetical protein
MTKELIIKIAVYLVLFIIVVFVGTFCANINVSVKADGSCYIGESKR